MRTTMSPLGRRTISLCIGPLRSRNESYHGGAHTPHMQPEAKYLEQIHKVCMSTNYNNFSCSDDDPGF